jgi:hypothetical protein
VQPPLTATGKTNMRDGSCKQLNYKLILRGPTTLQACSPDLSEGIIEAHSKDGDPQAAVGPFVQTILGGTSISPVNRMYQTGTGFYCGNYVRRVKNLAYLISIKFFS